MDTAFLKAASAAIVRHLLGIAAGMLVARGIWTEQQASEVVAAVAVALVSVGWSLLEKRNRTEGAKGNGTGAAALVLLCLTASAEAQTLPDDARAALQQAVTVGETARAVLDRYPQATIVPSGGNLQAALDAGPLVVRLEADGTYTAGSFTVTRSGTTIYGNGATIRGTSGPALRVPPGVNDVYVSGLAGTAAYSSVFAVGDNALTDATQVPQRVTFVAVTVPTHRGRRGFELHGADVRLLDGSVFDTWDPALGDSQGVWINNGPGPYLVSGGIYQAGSENILVGGAVTGIAGLIPADITIENLELSKPLSWKTDGVNRAVKNLLELKTGARVRVRDLVMTGSWKAGQDGYAFVITPRSGGAMWDVLIERVRIREVSSGFNITGHDEPHKPPTPARTTGLVVRDVTLVASKATYGGRGILALLGMGPDTLDFERIVAVVDGTTLVLGGDSERVGRLRIVDSYANLPQYGIFGNGYANLANWATWLDVLDITGNTFADGASGFRTQAPSNTYLPRAEWDALVAPMLQ